MDARGRKAATKKYCKELPAWGHLDNFMVELDKLETSIKLNKDSIADANNKADELLRFNTTGNLKIRPPRKSREPDIVRLYRKNAKGEYVDREESKENETTRLGKEKISADRIFSDATTNDSIKMLERRPQEGEEVFAMIDEDKPWVKCKIKYVYHKPVGKQRVTAFKLRFVQEKRAIEVNKYSVARFQNHGDKLRATKRVIAGPTDDDLRPGIIAQEPVEFNSHRYMVLMDNGSAGYFRPDQVYPIFYQSEIPWRDYRRLTGRIDRHLEAELNYFFKMYPRRHLLQTRVGSKINIKRNGLVLSCNVVAIDRDIMKVAYSDGVEENVYLGTTRVIMRADKVSELLASQFSFQHVYYKLPGHMKRYHDAGVTALGETFLKFVENFDSKLAICGPNTARKSTASRSNSPPRLKVKYDSRSVQDDRETKPRLQDLVEKSKLLPKCGPYCLDIPGLRTELDVENITEEFRAVSDLKVPLLLGWKRILVEQRKRNKPQYVYVYQAPCGKIYTGIYNIRLCLQATESKLDIDYFTFDREVDLNRMPIDQEAYVFEDNIAIDKTTKAPVEPKNITLMNPISEESLPLDFEYRSESFPHPMLRAKSFTFNPEFKSGCDCEDDCSVRASCACHRLNEEAYGSNAPHRGKINPKCQYKEKRLMEQVSTGIFECNSYCKCSSKCPNRVVQNGIRSRLQVRKTPGKGWGVVTLDDIPAGSFISTYAAELLDDADLYGDCDMYFADLDYITVVEGQKLGLSSDDENSDEGVSVDEDDDFDFTQQNKRRLSSKTLTSNVIHDDSDEDEDQSSNSSPSHDLNLEFMPSTSRYPRRNQVKNGRSSDSRKPSRFRKLHTLLGESHDYTLDARMQGNVGRFYNHSCDPNSFVQNIFIETHDLRFPIVAFFAKRSILAMDEITWNYNYRVNSIPGREIKCNCGSSNCQGRIL